MINSPFKKTARLFLPFIVNNPESRYRFCVTGFLIILDVVATSSVPYISKLIVDSLSISLSAAIGFLVILLGILWTMEKITSHLQEIIFFPIVNSVILELQNKVVDHVHRLPLSIYQTLSIPEIISSIKRISQSARLFIKIIALMIIPGFIKFIIAMIIASKLGFMGIGLLISFSLSVYTLYQGTKWYIQAREKAWQQTDYVALSINDSFLNTKFARFFQTFEMKRIKSLLHREAALWQTTNTKLHLIHSGLGLIMGVTLIVLLYSTLTHIQNQTLTIGDFILLKGQLIAAFLPLKTLSVEFRQLAEAMIDIQKITRVLELPREDKNKEPFVDETMRLKMPYQALRLNSVSFYNDIQKPIFTHLSASFPLGQKTALIGKSGCGKTSLVNLLAGLTEPTTGSVYIDDVNLNSVSNESLNKILHIIPQDLRLLNVSLRDNLSYGSTTSYSDSVLQQVIERVELEDLLNQLPNGFDSIVGEMGSRLSGGEKQRVAIARALLIKPQILILDETTHSLTVESEKRILSILFKTIPTVIIVSHRPQVLGLVDRVLKLEHNTLLEIDIISHLRYLGQDKIKTRDLIHA